MISPPIGLSLYLKSSTPATSTICMLSILGRVGSCRSGSASSWSFWPSRSKSARLGLRGKRNACFGLCGWSRFSPGRRLRSRYWPQLSGRKLVSEHGQAAARCFFFRLILDDGPVFGQFAICEAHDIRHDPIHRQADAAKPAVKHHVIAIGNHKTILVTEAIGEPFDHVEESLASETSSKTEPEISEFLTLRRILVLS